MREKYYVPIEKSSELTLQPIIYEINGSQQGNGHLKCWAFFSWKENSESSKYKKCNRCFYDEFCGWSSEPTPHSLHNTGLSDIPELLFNVDLWVLSLIELLHDYLVMS